MPAYTFFLTGANVRSQFEAATLGELLDGILQAVERVVRLPGRVLHPRYDFVLGYRIAPTEHDLRHEEVLACLPPVIDGRVEDLAEWCDENAAGWLEKAATNGVEADSFTSDMVPF